MEIKKGRIHLHPSCNCNVSRRFNSPPTSFFKVDFHKYWQFSYSFSPDEVGRWSVKASWSGNEDYVGASSNWVTFEVEAKKYTVSVYTSPPGLPIVVDGVQYAGSMTFQWSEGSTHNLHVQNTRFGFIVENVFSGAKIVSGQCEIVSQDTQAGTVVVRVNDPCVVKAVWIKDYTKLTIAAIASIAISLELLGPDRRTMDMNYIESEKDLPAIMYFGLSGQNVKGAYYLDLKVGAKTVEEKGDNMT